MVRLALTRRLRSGRRLMLSAATVVALAAGLGLPSTAAYAAVTTSRAPASCTGDYIVGYVNLTDSNTGVSSSAYGQTQLWYSNSCEINWTVVTSNLGTASNLYAEVDRSDGAYGYHYCYNTTSCASVGVYSPVLLDAAWGYIVVGGVEYYGLYEQPGFSYGARPRWKRFTT